MNLYKRVWKKITKPSSDRTKKYWKIAASSDLEKTMHYICDGFDRDTFETKKESIINIIPFEKHMTVLDLACGIGRTCKWVSPQVKEYYGVDFIPEMIRKAEKYNVFTNAHFFTNNGNTLDMFSDNHFDVVYCELAFQHMPKSIQKSYVNEVHRVLKKDGLFYVQIPTLDYFKDKSYARTKEETELLFANYSISYIDGNSGYYTVKAKKIV